MCKRDLLVKINVHRAETAFLRLEQCMDGFNGWMETFYVPQFTPVLPI